MRPLRWSAGQREHWVMKGRVRVRDVDGIVIVLFASRVRLAPDIDAWYAALERAGVRATMCLALGPIRSEGAQRRRTVEVLRRLRLPVTVITDHRFNHGLIRMFGYLGVSMQLYGWRKLDEAARALASRPAKIEEIVGAAQELRRGAQGQSNISGELGS